MKRLSIIIPVFNTEKYLDKCLRSVLEQDISPLDYEIIIINDGSTDHSELIASNYANNYPHVITVRQSNQGAGGARNTGMEHASGKYIQFLDGDDYLNPFVLKPLLDKMDFEKLDALRFNYQNVNEKYEVINPYKNSKQFVDYQDIITDGLTFLNSRLGYACYVPQFIFRSDLLFRTGNQFLKQIYFEDTEWIPRVLIQAKRVSSVSTIVFNYLWHQESITHSNTGKIKKKILGDRFLIIDSMQSQLRDTTDQRWYKGMITLNVISILQQSASGNKKEYASVISRLRNKNVFPLYSYNLTWKQKVHFFTINLSPRIYRLLIYILNHANSYRSKK